MPTFEFDGQRIAYTEFGGGPAAVVTRAALAGADRQERARRRAAADPACTGCCSPRRCTVRWPKSWPRAATA